MSRFQLKCADRRVGWAFGQAVDGEFRIEEILIDKQYSSDKEHGSIRFGITEHNFDAEMELPKQPGFYRIAVAPPRGNGASILFQLNLDGEWYLLDAMAPFNAGGKLVDMRFVRRSVGTGRRLERV